MRKWIKSNKLQKQILDCMHKFDDFLSPSFSNSIFSNQSKFSLKSQKNKFNLHKSLFAFSLFLPVFSLVYLLSIVGENIIGALKMQYDYGAL